MYWALRIVGVMVVLVGACTICQAEDIGSQPPIHVLFTIDVESRLSGGGLEQNVWGELPGETENHGITRMMEILDYHGVKGTFFVNVYEAPLHREGAMAEVCRTIHQRGHDIELHSHPGPMFGVLYMQYADLPTQTEILRQGARLLKEWTGMEPVAHRAGGHMANLDTLEACREVGIPLDFSYNIAWPASGLSHTGLTRNAPFVREGVLSVPETAYDQVGSPWQSLRILDIESSSPDEIRKVVADLRQHGVRTATILMHSFSFERFRKPNVRVERVFEDLVAGFVADPNVRVVTSRQLYDIWRSDPQALAGGDFMPTTGWRLTYCRAWQRLGEGWLNVVVAIAPIVCLGGIATASCLWWRHRRRRNKVLA
jgi:peptidoglycan/xylan/chitin deacetylase (PgdA/CDA1 family)